MDKIKIAIFETVYDAFRSYLSCKDGTPELDILHTRFCAMWDVLEAAHLEDEYQSWKASKH